MIQTFRRVGVVVVGLCALYNFWIGMGRRWPSARYECVLARGLWRDILCYSYLCRAQYPVLDFVPDFLAVNDSSWLLARNRSLVQSFVKVGIEAVTRWVKGFDVVFE
jgi:hypothetical protein